MFSPTIQCMTASSSTEKCTARGHCRFPPKAILWGNGTSHLRLSLLVLQLQSFCPAKHIVSATQGAWSDGIGKLFFSRQPTVCRIGLEVLPRRRSVCFNCLLVSWSLISRSCMFCFYSIHYKVVLLPDVSGPSSSMASREVPRSR